MLLLLLLERLDARNSPLSLLTAMLFQTMLKFKYMLKPNINLCNKLVVIVTYASYGNLYD